MRKTLPLLATLAFAVTACASEGSATPTDAAAGDLLPADCEVLLYVTVDGAANATLTGTNDITLRVVAEDLKGSGATLLVPSRCPDGAIQLSGLETGGSGYYDYYGTCTAGACMADLPPEQVDVPADGVATVATTALTRAGQCNAPLPEGTYPITLVLPTLEGAAPPKLCQGRQAVLIVR